MWYVRLSHTGSSMSKYGATNAPSASTPAGCTNPAEAARTTVVRQVCRVDERGPGETLGCLVGQGRLRLRGELAALRGVVGGERGVDVGGRDEPARGERDEQRPRQVGIDLEALEDRVAGAERPHLLPLRRSGRGAREGP